MIIFLLLVLVGVGFSQTTESNDGAYTEWMMVGDYISEPVNGTAEPLEDPEDLLDANDPPVLSDETCYDMLRSLDEHQEMNADVKGLNDDVLDQPYRFFGSGLYGNRFRPNRYLYGNRYRPFRSYGRCLRTVRYRNYYRSLCYGRRRVNYGSYTYCCRPNYFRPFVFRRGRYIRCRCY